MSDSPRLVSFFQVVKYPLITEKSVMQVEREKKVTFIVEEKSNKEAVKQAIESYFEVKVDKVNTLFTPEGEKKAIVTFAKADDAKEVAIALGII